MLYTAYLVMCMVGPIGSGGCAPAAKPLDFHTVQQCEAYIEREKENYREGKGLEALRPYLPSMMEGKLKMKSSCVVKFEEEWLGLDMPEVPELEIHSHGGENQ